MTEIIEYPEMPSIEDAARRAAAYLRKTRGSEYILDLTLPFHPNVLQGLWIVSYQPADNPSGVGGVLAVRADSVDEVGTSLDDPAFDGVEWIDDEADEEPEAPDDPLTVRESMALLAAANMDRTVAIMAVPDPDDPVNGIGGEQEKHATLLYFGNIDDHEDPARLEAGKEWMQQVLGALASKIPPFTARVTGVDTLGSEEPPADVWLLDSPNLQDLFGGIRAADDETAALYDGADATRYPEYTPHVTIGYGISGGDREMANRVREIEFDRLSLWWGNERIDFPFEGDPDTSEFEALFSLVAAGFNEKQIRIPPGNGRYSGRWMDTPGGLIDDLLAVIAGWDVDERARNGITDNVMDSINEARENARKLDGLTDQVELMDAIVDVQNSLYDAHDLLDRNEPYWSRSAALLGQSQDDLAFLKQMDWSLLSAPGDIGHGDSDPWLGTSVFDRPDWKTLDTKTQISGTKNALSDLNKFVHGDDPMAYTDKQADVLSEAVAYGFAGRIQETVDEVGLPLDVTMDGYTWDGRSVLTTFKLADRDSGLSMGSITRIYTPGEEVHNDYFHLNPQYQANGMGAALTHNLETWYAQNGVPKVTVHANIDVGGYTWAKLGFDLSEDQYDPDRLIGGILEDFVTQVNDVDSGGKAPKSFRDLDYVYMMETLDAGRSDTLPGGGSPIDFLALASADGYDIYGKPGSEEFEDAIAWLDEMVDDSDRIKAIRDDYWQMVVKDLDPDEFRVRDDLDTLVQNQWGDGADEVTMYDLATFGQGTYLQHTETRMNYDPEGTPTPQEIALWPGKAALLHSDWQGVKYLPDMTTTEAPAPAKFTEIGRNDLSNPQTPRTRPVTAEEFQELAAEGKRRLDALRGDKSKFDALISGTTIINAFESVKEEWGGSTIDSHTGVPYSEGTGYAMSVKMDGQVTVSIPIEGMTFDEFQKAWIRALIDFDDQLSYENAFLGVFRDEDTGQIQFDPVIIVQTLEDVETIGAYTRAVGGAYNMEDGNGYWPPYVEDAVSG